MKKLKLELIIIISKKMNFTNIKVLININSNEYNEINIKLDNLEKGDTINYLIGNVEKYLFLLNKNNNLSFHKTNLSIHKLVNNNEECLWSNNILRNKKMYEDLEIEDDSIYCFKFKNISDIQIPKFIKTGYISTINNNEIMYENFNKNFKIKCIGVEKDIFKFLAITFNYSLYFTFNKKEQKYIIEKSVNIEPKLSFNSNIEIKLNLNILNKIGFGKMIYSDGLTYDGKFNFIDLRNFYFIEGKAIYSDGRTMEGNFLKINNKIYLENGKIIYPNGNILDGQFDKIYLYFNKYCLLKGKKINKNKYIEEGLFNDNKLLEGKITNSNFIYEGLFDINGTLKEGKITDLKNNVLKEVIFNDNLDKKNLKKRKFTDESLVDKDE